MLHRTLAALLLTTPISAAASAFAGRYIPDETLLQDDITYTIHWDGSYAFEENVAVRLNTEAAVANDGESYIGYSGSQDTVKILDAYTTTPDDRRLDVAGDKILDQSDGDGDHLSRPFGRRGQALPLCHRHERAILPRPVLRRAEFRHRH
jgi:hypothetical protein